MARIVTFQEKNIFRGSRYNEAVLSEDTTLGQAIDEAVRLGCPIIVRRGKGMWYLKGKGRNVTEIENKLVRSTTKYPNRTLYLVKI